MPLLDNPSRQGEERVYTPPLSGGHADPADGRYTAVAQLLHWVTAALMFTALPLAWVAVNMPEAASARDMVFSLHKSVGLTIFLVVAFRLLWRAWHPAPPLPVDLSPWEKHSATLSHWLLYLILIGMPFSGYVLSATSGHPIAYFGLFGLPVFQKNDVLQHAALLAHVITGQWFVYALILLHIAATAWHVVIRRDGILERMLPSQRQGPSVPK